MYVVTFYSYKGGVGRTMSLVNVAAELARRKKRVLIVDFDLEAPGINTFDFCAGAGSTPGIVDYITDYLATNVAPPVHKYVYECNFATDEDVSPVWVMPAGLQNRGYKSTFHSIDWGGLYRDHSGYLLMENLKAQWEAELRPDYVLIDSRTGHTDVSGICTRQLPDAVVFTFFPNKQNLSGLKQIVEEVRAEATGGREKKIQNHFLASNVPVADDEHQILQKNLALFGKQLGYTDYSTVRHYDSLDLVDQVVFTIGHRKTRLANEYIQLTDTIIRENPADKEGALSYLRLLKSRTNEIEWREIKDRIDLIESIHQKDPAILAALARLFDAYDDVPSAYNFVERAIEYGGGSPDYYRDLGILNMRMNRQGPAFDAFRKILNHEGVPPHHVKGALRTLILIGDPEVPKLVELSSVQNLDEYDTREVIDELRTKPELLESALILCVRHSVKAGLTPDERRMFSGEIPLIEIALGKFKSAMEHLGSRKKVLKDAVIGPIFNLAMAEWGATGHPPLDLLERVVELDDPANLEAHTAANYAQCLAIACWAVGKVTEARDWVHKSRTAIQSPGHREREFTCWSYLRVPRPVFLADLESIEKMINGEGILPEFIARNAQLPLS